MKLHAITLRGCRSKLAKSLELVFTGSVKGTLNFLRMIKRFIDIVVAALALIVLAPLFVFIAYQVRRKLGTPILFRQTRSGLNGAPFEITKFRTMIEVNDIDGKPLPDEDRLNSFGIWLRSTSLDELPQLWSVLHGTMSLVGPRPQLMKYLPLYSVEQFRRHAVRPGITGWAQVNGRNTLSWEKKFKLDVWYVDHQSFWLDMKILILTIKSVITREGINSSSHKTMPLFTGSESKVSKNEKKS